MAESSPVRFGLCCALTAALVLGLASCDALTAPKTEHVTMSWNGDTSVTAGLRVSIPVTVTVGDKPYGNPRFHVVSSDTTILAINSTNDTLRAVRLGRATVTITLENALLAGTPPTLSQTILVIPQSIRFGRAADTVHSLGETTTPSIVAVDANGDSIPGVVYAWSSSDTTISKVNSRGQVTSVANGTVQIRAVVEGDTAQMPFTVAQLLVHFAITPPLAVTLNAINADTMLMAAGRDSLGSPVTGAAGVPLWVLKTPNVVSISQSGNIQAINNGTTYAYATSGIARDSVQVNVVQQATRLLVTSPNGFGIAAVNGTLTLSVAAFDRLNNPVTNDQATLVSLDPSIAQVASATRVVTGLSPGTARIVASLDAIADTVKIIVTNLPAKLVLNVDTASIPAVGDTIQLTAIVYNANGSVIQGATPTWYTTDSTVVTVLQTGRVVALRTGGTRVIAVYGGVSDTAVVSVTNSAQSLRILKHNDTLASLGDTLTIPIQILNARGQALPPTAATWTSNDPTIATVSSTGLTTAIGVGQTVVHAASGVLRDTAIVTVSNNPAAIVLNSTLDTMTARGQQLLYTAQLTNRAGKPVTGAPIVWTSTVPSVASVTTAGLVTALTNGTTKIVATSGTVSAQVTVVVRSPTTVVVDNSTLDTLFFGTSKRPFMHIEDGVNFAVPGDTVFVRVGVGPYSEEVVINKAIVLRGDPTAYLANGNDPTKLPLLSHDTGTAGILSTSPARVTVRTLGIRHTLDGPAIDARTALIAINQVFVNPSADAFSTGRGISVQSTNNATIDSSAIQTVHGYGVSFRGVSNGRINQVSVVNVVFSTTADTTYGAGITVIKGNANTISNDYVRFAAGVAMFIDSTGTALLTGSNFAGEGQLVRVLFSGSATATGNAFDSRLQPGETFTGTSVTDGRSGLELNGATGVSVTSNTFVDNNASQMDQIRFIGTRGAGASLVRNTFQGGRFNVRTELSDWTMTASRSNGPVAAVAMTNADTVTLSSDTLANAAGNCVQFTGSSGHLTVSGGLYQSCAASAAAAITSTSTQAALDITGASFLGPTQRAIDVKGGHHVVLRANSATPGGGAVSGLTDNGVFDLSADSVTVVGNGIADYPSFSGINLAGGVVRTDSNLVTVNANGIVVGNVTAYEASRNDIFDNDTAGVVNDRASSVTLTNNFWGDSLGPRRNGLPSASGDTIIGAATFTPVRSQPTYAGSRSAALRSVRGSGQSASAGSTLPEVFDVRVVDASGEPVANVQVTFQITGGNGTLNGGALTLVNVATGSDGLSRVTLKLGSTPGTNTVTASVPGLSSVNFTATGQ